MKKHIVLGIISFSLFTLAAFYISYPLIFHLTNLVTGELVIAWIMNWNIHALTHGLVLPFSKHAFFDANIFYPYHMTLAYSDLLITSSIFALPFFLLIHEPIVPSNITFISSLILLGWCTYLLVFSLTKNFFASLLSGMLIIFSPVTLDKRYHLQILAIEWIPLALFFFLQFVRQKRYRFLLLSLFCFLLQTYNSFMAGYFLLFSYAGIYCTYFFIDRKAILFTITRKTIISFVFSFLLILPIVIPYYAVSHEFSFVRDIRETIHLALQPEDLLVTNELSRLSPALWFFDAKQYPPTAEVKPGFPGLIFSLLILFSTGYCIGIIKKRIRKRDNKDLFAFLSIGLFGLVLSFGPALHLGRLTIHHPSLIPLPYALAYYILPGFQGIRDSSRFEMLFNLSIAVVIGVVMDRVLQKRPRILQIALYGALLLGVVLEFHGPISYQQAYTFEDFPPVYNWIATYTPSNAIILEAPVYNWDNNPFGDNREVLREYFSTLHFRKLISGGSGFSPPPWQMFAKMEFADFPSYASIMAIKHYGANYLIVHADEFDELHAEKWKAGNHVVYPSSYILSTLSQNNHLRFIIREGSDYVYKVI